MDVIHTAAGMVGYLEPIGHCDFYPNGGKASQPGCDGWVSEMIGNVRLSLHDSGDTHHNAFFVCRSLQSWPQSCIFCRIDHLKDRILCISVFVIRKLPGREMFEKNTDSNGRCRAIVCRRRLLFKYEK